jgi:tRNA-2-methylthio-N6-dimethylallyladenosine synthase
MKRGYTVERYRDLVGRIRAALPDAAIHTDIIVGFPGETEAQFMGSHRLIEELRLDKVHLARYSARPQTYAARRFVDDVPPAEKERRLVALDELQRRIQAEKNAPLLGRTLEVLVEDRDDKRGRWRGRTRDDRLVCFSAPGPESLRGHLVDVRIDWTGPYSLIGEAAGNEERPQRQ